MYLTSALFSAAPSCPLLSLSSPCAVRLSLSLSRERRREFDRSHRLRRRWNKSARRQRGSRPHSPLPRRSCHAAVALLPSNKTTINDETAVKRKGPARGRFLRRAASQELELDLAHPTGKPNAAGCRCCLSGSVSAGRSREQWGAQCTVTPLLCLLSRSLSPRLLLCCLCPAYQPRSQQQSSRENVSPLALSPPTSAGSTSSSSLLAATDRQRKQQNQNQQQQQKGNGQQRQGEAKAERTATNKGR